VAAPGGYWNVIDDGLFSIDMVANSVKDGGAVSVPTRTAGGFIVDIQPPSATLTAANVTAAASLYTFTVKYLGAFPINHLTLGSNDIRVTGPGGYNVLATYVSDDSGGTDTNPITVTYSIVPPSGNWSLANRGRYTISVEPNSVLDTDGGAVASGSIGTFIVAVPNSGATFVYDITADEDDDNFAVGDTSLRASCLQDVLGRRVVTWPTVLSPVALPCS